MWLSEHFHLSELVNSNEAVRRGIDNTPDEYQLDNLIALCENVLEPVREYYNQAVRVSSGFRCAKLNKIVGGAATSQHCTGEAADIEIADVDNCELAQYIADSIEFDQLILEFHEHDAGPNSGWVHVSYSSAGNNRREILTAKLVNGRTVYSRGIN